MNMKNMIRRIIQKAGYDIVRFRNDVDLPDLDKYERNIIQRVKPYTMTSQERIVSLIHAIQYVVKNNIQGSIVECGVWKGGSMMAAALTLMDHGCNSKDLYLFDTYEGMSSATDNDVSITGVKAQIELMTTQRTEDSKLWAYSPIEKVQNTLYSTGYPKKHMHFVKGMVEETIPDKAPTQICLLRLDTDWYESTKHELLHLYPRLSVGGVLIVDDYGHWKGARRAVDEYFELQGINLLLNRVDYTGRIAIKTA
jgi:O-methyltransferase